MKKFATHAVVAIAALGTGYLLLRAVDKPAPVQAPTVPIKSVTAESIAKLEMNASVDEKMKDMKLGELMKLLSEKTGLNITVDQRFFSNSGDPTYEEVENNKVPVNLKKSDTVREVLEKICAYYHREFDDYSHHINYKVKGTDVVIGQGYYPVHAPLGITRPAKGVEGLVPDRRIIELLHGKTLTIDVHDMTLDDFVTLIRDRTGSNIVINRERLSKSEKRISLTLSCVSTLTALRLAAEVSDLSVTSFDNVFYISTQEKIDKMNIVISKAIYVKPELKEIKVPVDQDGRVYNPPIEPFVNDLEPRSTFIPVCTPRPVPIFTPHRDTEKKEPKK
jgi:hypothetical protein